MPTMPTIVDDHMTRTPQTIDSDRTLETASETMRARGVRHLPVREQGKLVGIITERDVSRYLVVGAVLPFVALVREAMKTNVFTVPPGTPLSEVSREMAERKCGSVLVVSAGEVVGIFTSVDLARVLSNTLVTLERIDDAAERPSAH